MGKAVLIVDDDRLMRSFLASILGDEGHDLEAAANGREGLSRLRQRDFDLIVTDLKMPDMDGLELIRLGREIRPDSRWIVITAYGSINNAVEAMKLGASDYLTKPFRDPDEFRHVVRRVLREAEKDRKIQIISEELDKNQPPLSMIFLGEGMAAVRQLTLEVAPTTATVLITGPSGTGKELIARVIHQHSPRRDKPFVAVNCAALAETILESELFGHEKGAFTGAAALRKGRFELADGGSLFLDEIGDLPPAVQVKLLRVLQERQFERVGGVRTISVDVRVITATNRNLREEMAAGRFREDLFYRLNVFPIALPRLRERREAILPLARYFMDRFAENLGKGLPVLTEAAEQALLGYEWPGNIRELQNVMERGMILAQGELDVRQLNVDRSDHAIASPEGLLKIQEAETIRRILALVQGNRREAARRLGISLRTLQYRIRELKL
ncbi:MAG: sigma-54 dependent transcriptional regulator [Smithellaceae bacterium]|nr:sigma-54 dependent transcriptional regulator [Smithellaceae bacterium]